MVVDCEVSEWGPWSECDAGCGPGRMTRSRSVIRFPENGGRHCPSLVQKRGCQGTIRCGPHSPRSAIKDLLNSAQLRKSPSKCSTCKSYIYGELYQDKDNKKSCSPETILYSEIFALNIADISQDIEWKIERALL
ncbi:hypothetical protein J437_LFUL005671 [Ladona fulva]|uniref:Spondin-like TSP1 domain-containing protein n=1 Tax=Ladona fulva TaxID=123851 RepID=A0A8K0K256_LADFU|nr:hypothetical protein J437_LFUL005671 [Ladona fulva]